MRTKIAFLIRDLNYGGAQRQLVTLIKNIDRQLFDVTLLCFYAGGELLADLPERDYKVICLEKKGRWDLWGFSLRLFKQLKTLQPSILHGYLCESNLFSILAKPFFPSTQIVWGIRASNLSVEQYGLVGKILNQAENFLSTFADLIIVNSHCGRDYCQCQGYPCDKMVVISNGIDTEKFQPNLSEGSRVRAEWGVKDATILVGLVGRIDPMKGHANFLKAAARLALSRADIQFVCIGVGPEKYTQALVKLADELNISERIIWAGGRSDMPAVFNALDLVCSASVYGEGFPNVIGEAMASGVPCVATDVGDSAWIVGNLGLLVPPQNFQELELAIDRITSKSQFNHSNPVKIRQAIIDRFSVQQLVLNTQATLLRTVEGSPICTEYRR
jgi:glycosyltransferase involved in cell wall biosynthesis